MLVAHTESVRVARPASVVWRLVGDPATWERWAGSVDRVRVHGSLEPGAQVTYRHRGKPVAVVVSAHEPERRLTITQTEKSYEMVESIELEDLHDATTVSITMAFEPRTPWARVAATLARPFRGAFIGRPVRGSLDALRRAAEELDAG